MLSLRILLCLLGLIIFDGASAQMVQRHILKSTNSYNHRQKATQQLPDTINLPFWDDFSTGIGEPNPALWVDSENVLINSTLGSSPPTLNVATFDGIDAFGVPYDINSQFVGNTDNLTSRSIDLSQIVANKLNTVYISFFWQARGNGEIPNEDDSLRLQFLRADSVWVTQFMVEGGESAVRTNSVGEDIFTQEIFNIAGPEFLHSGFRFRFQSFGRQTGNFDSWHVDYVFVNQDRDLSDLAYFDRGITSTPSPLFGEYSSMPADQFFQSPSEFVDSIQFELFNLDNLPHPVEYSLNVYDVINNVLIDQTNEPTTAPILTALERRFFHTNTPDLSTLGRADSIVLETELIYNTGDLNLIEFINPVSGDTTFYENVNYKVNDTLRQQFTIQDYLAYDDGTAEFAAGINQIRGQLAYQYVVPSQDTLTDIEIYFPRIAPSSEGLPIEIIVWRQLSDESGSLLAKQPYTIQQQEGLNEFTRYTLEIPLIVSDTIYIGWEQFSDNFIGVGLDKNTDSGDRIFANVDGEWRGNVGIEGSLMLRPRFRSLGSRVVTSVEEIDFSEEISIYPNPNRGVFQIDGDYDSIKIYDLAGHEVPFTSQGGRIELTHKNQGIFVVSFTNQGKVFSKKLVITP